MTGHPIQRMPWWAWFWPVASCAILAAALSLGFGTALAIPAAVALIATVFAAVFPAELVAHRVGESFGTLVLAIAVTVIEVALIVSVMLSGGAGKAELARDTVSAAVILVCNGVVGACLVMGGVRHGRQRGACGPGGADRADAGAAGRRSSRHRRGVPVPVGGAVSQRSASVQVGAG